MPAMLGLRGIVLVALGTFGAGFSGVWARNLLRLRREPAAEDPATRVGVPSPVHLGIGFVTNFLDTFSIGSYATTTSLYRLLHQVPERLIPGTLLIGHTFATLTEAFIFIAGVRVEIATLVSLIAAAVLGAWLGAGVVSRLPNHKMQMGMGVALLVAAALMFAKLAGLLPGGGGAVGLGGARLAIGLAGSFVIGAMMTIGVGNFAPSLVLYGLLGMDTKAIFPVMMGSCAFLMTVAGVRFMRLATYAPRPALGLTLGGVPGVLVAYFVVEKLPTLVLSWLVLGVVVYTAASMLRSGMKNENAAALLPPEAHR
jgi:uncharacterized membrane protein YfcA